MTRPYTAGSLRKVATCVVVFMVGQGGCQVAETRKESEPYFLSRGMWCANYNRGFMETREATLAATAELKMAFLREVREGRGAFFDCQTSDGYPVRIHLHRHGGPGRPEGEGTLVSIRVQGYGTHREVCEPILNQIGTHLASAPVLPTPPPPLPAPATGPVTSSLPTQPAPLDPGLPAQPVPLGK
jgi:hypothetical protein